MHVYYVVILYSCLQTNTNKEIEFYKKLARTQLSLKTFLDTHSVARKYSMILEVERTVIERLVS